MSKFYILFLVAFSFKSCAQSSNQSYRDISGHFVYIDRPHGDRSLIVNTTTKQVIVLPRDHKAVTGKNGEVFVDGHSNVVMISFSQDPDYLIDTNGTVIKTFDKERYKGGGNTYGRYTIYQAHDGQLKKYNAHLTLPDGTPVQMQRSYTHIENAGNGNFAFRAIDSTAGYMTANEQIILELSSEFDIANIRSMGMLNEGKAVICMYGRRIDQYTRELLYYGVNEQGVKEIDFQAVFPGRKIEEIGSFTNGVYPVMLIATATSGKDMTPVAFESDDGNVKPSAHDDDYDIILVNPQGIVELTLPVIHNYKFINPHLLSLNSTHQMFDGPFFIFDIATREYYYPPRKDDLIILRASEDYVVLHGSPADDRDKTIQRLYRIKDNTLIRESHIVTEGVIDLLNDTFYSVSKSFKGGNIYLYKYSEEKPFLVHEGK